RPFRPQVHHIRIDARIGVIVLADLARDGAVQCAGDGHFLAFGIYFRIVEARLAGDEAAVALSFALRTRLRIQGPIQHEEAALRLLRFVLDDAAAPAHARALRDA